jgi:hypothetical protein
VVIRKHEDFCLNCIFCIWCERTNKLCGLYLSLNQVSIITYLYIRIISEVMRLYKKLKVLPRATQCFKKCCYNHLLFNIYIKFLHKLAYVVTSTRQLVYLLCLGLRRANKVKVIWRFSSFSGGGKPQVSLRGLFKDPVCCNKGCCHS